MIRRFGAIGDVHAEDTLLSAALDRLSRERCDVVFAVGDIVDGRGDVERCCHLLRERATVVRGNHERWLLADEARTLPQAHLRDDLSPQTIEWLTSLPATRTLESSAGKLLLCHGVGEDDMVRLLPDDEPPALADNTALQKVLGRNYEVMVCGHTHKPMVRTLFGLLVVNAGTLHHADNPGFVHVDLDAKIAQMFVIDPDDARVLEAERIPFGAPGDDVWGAGW